MVDRRFVCEYKSFRGCLNVHLIFVAMSSVPLGIIQIALLCACYAFAASDVDWWEAATLYQIYPRSYMDSDGDGVGDLNGITSRLPFLKEIGVTATWLSPIYDSPMFDMGYDITNFTKISPLFGQMDDFDAMVAKAHKLGLKIILDFVPNHSSDQCEWFQKSIRREDGYDDFYMWDDGKIDRQTGERIPPSNWVSNCKKCFSTYFVNCAFYSHRIRYSMDRHGLGTSNANNIISTSFYLSNRISISPVQWFAGI